MMQKNIFVATVERKGIKLGSKTATTTSKRTIYFFFTFFQFNLAVFLFDGTEREKKVYGSLIHDPNSSFAFFCARDSSFPPIYLSLFLLSFFVAVDIQQSDVMLYINFYCSIRVAWRKEKSEWKEKKLRMKRE